MLHIFFFVRKGKYSLIKSTKREINNKVTIEISNSFSDTELTLEEIYKKGVIFFSLSEDKRVFLTFACKLIIILI